MFAKSNRAREQGKKEHPLQLQEGCEKSKQNPLTPKLNGIRINGIVEDTSVRTWDKN